MGINVMSLLGKGIKFGEKYAFKNCTVEYKMVRQDVQKIVQRSNGVKHVGNFNQVTVKQTLRTESAKGTIDTVWNEGYKLETLIPAEGVPMVKVTINGPRAHYAETRNFYTESCSEIPMEVTRSNDFSESVDAILHGENLKVSNEIPSHPEFKSLIESSTAKVVTRELGDGAHLTDLRHPFGCAQAKISIYGKDLTNYYSESIVRNINARNNVKAMRKLINEG